MRRARRHPGIAFAACGVLAILGVFVLHGTASGIVLLVTMIAFVGACVLALRGTDPDDAAQNTRAGLTGWFGGWF
jgi:hypothetical protein